MNFAYLWSCIGKGRVDKTVVLFKKESWGKYQNCHLVLKGFFLFFLFFIFIFLFFFILYLVLYFFSVFILVLQVLSAFQISENQSLLIPVTIL